MKDTVLRDGPQPDKVLRSIARYERPTDGRPLIAAFRQNPCVNGRANRQAIARSRERWLQRNRDRPRRRGGEIGDNSRPETCEPRVVTARRAEPPRIERARKEDSAPAPRQRHDRHTCVLLSEHANRDRARAETAWQREFRRADADRAIANESDRLVQQHFIEARRGDEHRVKSGRPPIGNQDHRSAAHLAERAERGDI